VSTSATVAEAGSNPQRGSRDAGSRAHALLLVLWFLYLFAPTKVITYYVPAARPLNWIPELLLWVCGILWLRSPVPKRGFPAYTWFMVVLLLGAGVAYLVGTWGVARDTIRHVYQYYLLGLITLSFCTTPERARPILGLYFGAFLWYGLWGLISLKTSPLAAAVDPGTRVIVPWHPEFDNRDAFGPLMVAGLFYSIYYLQANRAVRTRALTLSAVSGMGLTLLGFITTFGRGAFLGFMAAVISIWLRSRRKIAILLAVALGVGSFCYLAPGLASKYLATMQTITKEGMEAGTGADRAALWGIAWREFLDSPIVGVGTANYGPASWRVLGANEIGPGGYTRGRLWERVTHSAPMAILAENGLIGAVAALVLIADFFRTNRRTRIHAAGSSGAGSDRQPRFAPGYVQATAMGLNAAFLAILVSSIFYELLYSPLIWNAIVLNRMLYFSSGADVALQSDVPAG
jgi:O-Antigen ligase